MDAGLIATIYGLFFLALWVYFIVFVLRNGPALLKLYREKINPPYPLTSEELHKEVGGLKDPFQGFQLMLSTVFNQQKVLWTKDSGNKRIDKLAYKIRKTFLTILTLILVGAVITFALLALSSNN